MKIAICDDNAAYRQQIYQCIQDAGVLNSDDKIIQYNSGLDYLKDNEEVDLLLLDVEMPGLSGMEMLRKYPEHFTNTKVVLVTSYEDYLYEGYEVGVFRYIKKPARQEEIEKLFNALHSSDPLSKKIEVLCQGRKCEITLSNIAYIESCNNHCEIVTSKGQMTVYQSLKELESLFTERFFVRPHKSYLINWKHVKEFNRQDKYLLMSNDHRIYIAKKRYKMILEAYINMV